MENTTLQKYLFQVKPCNRSIASNDFEKILTSSDIYNLTVIVNTLTNFQAEFYCYPNQFEKVINLIDSSHYYYFLPL